MKDYKISTASFWKFYGIYFLGIMILSFIFPNLPLWLKILSLVLSLLFILAIYNPIRRVKGIWRLKYLIFRPENAEDLRAHIEEGLSEGKIEEGYVHVSFDKEGKKRMGSEGKPFKGWLQGSKKDGNVVDGKKENL